MEKELKIYRKNGTLIYIKKYDEDGYLLETKQFTPQEVLESLEIFDIGEDLEKKIYYRNDGTIKEVNSYRTYMNLGLDKVKNKKYFEKVKDLALWIKRKYNSEGILEQFIEYKEDGTIGKIENYNIKNDITLN